MSRDLDRLARSTLRRQFPTVRGRGEAAVLALLDRIGPVQSQVPRTPFLTAASRLPGVPYAAVEALLERHRLVKASTLRGTVHVSTPDQLAAQIAVCRPQRSAAVASQTGWSTERVQALWADLEAFCADGWRSREEVVERAAAFGEPAPAAPLVWGHAALLRRPSDGAWERRTDTLRRTYAGEPVSADEGRRTLVRVHLRAYGPATRRDIAWWLGDTVTAVDAAVAALGDEVVRRPGPAADPLLDLADPPIGGRPDPGVVLLPEFDGLLLGFHPGHRDRFLDPSHLPLVWNRANGLFRPLVLARGRIAATWRTTRPARRTAIEVRLLPGAAELAESDLAEPVAAAATALALEITGITIARVSP